MFLILQNFLKRLLFSRRNSAWKARQRCQLFGFRFQDHLIWFATIQSVGTSSWLTTFVSPGFALHGHGGMLEQRWYNRTCWTELSQTLQCENETGSLERQKVEIFLILAEGLQIQIVWSRGNTKHSFDYEARKAKVRRIVELVLDRNYTLPAVWLPACNRDHVHNIPWNSWWGGESCPLGERVVKHVAITFDNVAVYANCFVVESCISLQFSAHVWTSDTDETT